MTGHPFSWPGLSMGHLEGCDHSITLRELQWALLYKKRGQKQKTKSAMNSCPHNTYTQIYPGRFFISYWTDDFNHSQLIRKDVMYLIIFLRLDLSLHIMLFSLADPFLSSIMGHLLPYCTAIRSDFMTERRRAPEKFRFFIENIEINFMSLLTHR